MLYIKDSDNIMQGVICIILIYPFPFFRFKDKWEVFTTTNSPYSCLNFNIYSLSFMRNNEVKIMSSSSQTIIFTINPILTLYF